MSFRNFCSWFCMLFILRLYHNMTSRNNASSASRKIISDTRGFGSFVNFFALSFCIAKGRPGFGPNRHFSR